MIEVGRIAMKIAGRDAGKKGIIVDILDNNQVLLDGSTRRRKININHIEPLDEIITIKKGASHEEVKKALSKSNIEVKETKPKQTGEKPKRVRKKKEKQPEKTKKAATPKETKEKPEAEKTEKKSEETKK